MADNADEVADDYRQALEDLTMNSRIEIATLTNIARENANHGLAIAEVLTNHIKKVPPNRTLPALYVLDSVVKNVPTPYSLYFGKKLYTIFMGAYAKVDHSTRRKMEEMLRTWKEPVPGSISTKPVFPPEYVRPIESALIGVRNAGQTATHASLQEQQLLLRGNRPPPGPARDTPTPPMARPPSHQGVVHGQPPFPGPNGHPQQQPYPMRPMADPNLAQHRATPPLHMQNSVPPYQRPLSREAYGAPAPGISIDKLKADIQELIVAEKMEFAKNPRDTSKQTVLKALLDLQAIMESQNMPYEQLKLVRDRVDDLAVKLRASAPPPTAPPLMHYPSSAPPYVAPTPPIVGSQQPTPVSAAPPFSLPARPPSVPTGAPPPTGGSLTLDALFGHGALAALSKAPKPATPVMGSGYPSTTPTPQPQPVGLSAALAAALRSPPPQLPGVQQAPPTAPAPIPTPSAAGPTPPPVASSLASNPSALLAMLRQSGLIKPATAPIPPTTTAPKNPYLANLTIPRPYNPSTQLYHDLGPPCTQCGRRFSTDDMGRAKKTAHMDWHFRVHQRTAEYEKRGQYRSPFVDEMDWIASSVTLDGDYTHPNNDGDSSSSFNNGNATDGNGNGKSGGGGGDKNKLGGIGGGRGRGEDVKYIPVPEDSSRVNSICPICQERFEMKWLDEAQEWVWMDAVKIGERVYHASCHREAVGDGSGNGNGSKGDEGGGERGGGSVLGKRKAEDEYQSFRRTAFKAEGY